MLADLGRYSMGFPINNRIYEEFAHTWWDEHEFLHLLKVMVNPWRVPYFKNELTKYYGRDFSQVHLLDIGCGGGVLTEEFALLGCQVTGIDISPQSDVLEHIPDWKLVLAEAKRVLKPGGLFFFDTINRTLKSKAVMIYALQEFPLTKLMPPDTHIWEMFITPDEITAALREQNMLVEDMKGSKIAQNPLAALWAIRQQKQRKITFAELGRRLKLKLDKDLSLNYLGYAGKIL
jgi:2-polyprenyl-6-hydroxyphenyl methylase/3-demethylubiquinone-9 3-methyltransferase